MVTKTAVTPGLTGLEVLESSGSTAAERRRVAVVRSVFEGFSRGDFRVLIEALGVDGTVWVVGLTPEPITLDAATIAGGDGPLGTLAGLMSNGMHFDFTAAAVEGPHVFVEWKDEAVTSSGAFYRNDGLSVFVFDDDDRIRSYREYLDPNKFMAIL